MQRQRSIRTTMAAFGAAITLTAVCAACTTAPSEPAAPRGVHPVAVDMKFLPEVSASERHSMTAELGRTLKTLYTRGFVLPKATGATPAPTTIDVMRSLGPLFAPGARRVLQAHQDVFTLGRNLDLLRGRIGFSGVVTRNGNVVTALLNIHFSGNGSRTNEPTPVILVDQRGTMLLARTESGWFVREFDLKITTKPAPTPTPS